MPNLIGPITNFELEIAGFTAINGAQFSGDDPTLLKGQSASLTVPTRTWERADSEAGGISPDQLFTHIAAMEATFNTESYAVDSGGATIPMLFGQMFRLITYQHIRDGSLGLPRGTGQRVMEYGGACFEIDEGEQSQRSQARMACSMVLHHFKETIKSGTPQFGAALVAGAAETLARTSADIVVFELDTRTDVLNLNEEDVLSEMAAALGYTG